MSIGIYTDRFTGDRISAKKQRLKKGVCKSRNPTRNTRNTRNPTRNTRNPTRNTRNPTRNTRNPTWNTRNPTRKALEYELEAMHIGNVTLHMFLYKFTCFALNSGMMGGHDLYFLLFKGKYIMSCGT